MRTLHLRTSQTVNLGPSIPTPQAPACQARKHCTGAIKTLFIVLSAICKEPEGIVLLIVQAPVSTKPQSPPQNTKPPTTGPRSHLRASLPTRHLLLLVQVSGSRSGAFHFRAIQHGILNMTLCFLTTMQKRSWATTS